MTTFVCRQYDYESDHCMSSKPNEQMLENFQHIFPPQTDILTETLTLLVDENHYCHVQLSIGSD